MDYILFSHISQQYVQGKVKHDSYPGRDESLFPIPFTIFHVNCKIISYTFKVTSYARDSQFNSLSGHTLHDLLLLPSLAFVNLANWAPKSLKCQRFCVWRRSTKSRVRWSQTEHPLTPSKQSITSVKLDLTTHRSYWERESRLLIWLL